MSSHSKENTCAATLGGKAWLVLVRCSLVLLLGFLPIWASLSRAVAQTSADAAFDDARFEDARRVAGDPFGNIYVIDEGAGRLVRIGADGRRFAIGGRGSDLRFPAGVDPTNGLLIVVADRAGRLFRYSREMAMVGEVGPGSLRGPLSARGQSSEDTSRRGVGFEGRIAPADVLVGPEGDVFFIDERQNHVAKLDALYRFERRIGGYEAGSAALVDPVAMCMSRDGTLVVADAGRGALVRFDSYGSYLGERLVRQGETMRSISCVGQAVLVTFDDRIDVVSGADSATAVTAPEGEDLRDVLPRQDAWLLLTARRLYRVPVPDVAEEMVDGDAAGR